VLILEIINMASKECRLFVTGSTPNVHGHLVNHPQNISNRDAPKHPPGKSQCQNKQRGKHVELMETPYPLVN